ncbi:MAG: rubrerythrin family protein [Anaerolineae bacterium]|jgi:rubrerythrin
MATSENLKEAFAGESQANRRYLAFAKQAEADGYPMVARLFRAAAEAETVHAHAHLRAMGGIADTRQNLEAAIAGEGFEFKEMYPKFLAEAQEEKVAPAITTFKRALAVEEIHHWLYTSALEAVDSGKDLPESSIFICTVCGHTVMGEPPERCPVCGARREQYSEIE